MKNSFDWKGLYFSFKILVVGLILGLAAQYSLTYYTSRTPNPTTTASVVVVAPKPTAPLPLQNTYSTTTPVRVINSLTIADAVPTTGKFIAADLVQMKIFLYQNGQEVEEFPILTKGRPGTPWETPAGFYTIQTKEPSHFSTIGHVYMPYSMQFYGNYFIHGWTYYPDGTPVSASFSGGCIKLKTEFAAKVFAFADVGTKVFVYDAKQTPPLPSLVLSSWARPNIFASTYLVADIDTRDVYAEHDARIQQTTGETTKLMTALVANEIISLNKVVSVQEGELSNPPDPSQTSTKKFLVDDLFYPLLMHPGSVAADSLAAYYGNHGFVRWMNTTAHALSMDSTVFVDPNGTSPDNLSTPEDLFRLMSYLANKKSFVLNIMQTPRKKITATDGTPYIIKNTVFPLFSNTLPYQKLTSAPTEPASPEEGSITPSISPSSDQSHTDLTNTNTTSSTTTVSPTDPNTPAISVLSFNIGTTTRRIVIIILGSSNQAKDEQAMAQWVTTASAADSSDAACTACTEPHHYRKISE